MKPPLDLTDHSPDPRSEVLHLGIPDGRYVYVQDEHETIWIVPDDVPHLHPKVLGRKRPAKYAGDLTIKDGKIADVTNCSGTFQFDDADGLRRIAELLRQQGWDVETGSVRLFSHTVAARPVILE